jgi:hypothetical protein
MIDRVFGVHSILLLILNKVLVMLFNVSQIRNIFQ